MTPEEEDEFWREGAGFRWHWPRLTVYKPADTKFRVGLNRYPHNVIGAGMVAFGRCWSITWRGTR